MLKFFPPQIFLDIQYPVDFIIFYFYYIVKFLIFEIYQIMLSVHILFLSYFSLFLSLFFPHRVYASGIIQLLQ